MIKTVWSCRVIGTSILGAPIECFETGRGPDAVLFIASIHGSEPAGTPLLARLRLHLQENPNQTGRYRVLVIPVANPDGYSAAERFNRSKVDLNRNFPADNRTDLDRHGPEPLSEPEARVLYRLIVERRPVRIVSIHQPLDCVDYDGDAEMLARRMASAADMVVKKIGARPGSLGSWAGADRGIPTITLELPKGVQSLPAGELWDRYGPALLEALKD